MTNDWRKIVTNTREKYKKLQPIACPAFGNELIYFNRNGFNHLVRAGKRARSVREQIRRVRLFERVVSILSISKSFQKYRKLERYIVDNPNGKSTAQFWAFICKKKGNTVIVLIRQLNNGHKHFFSVMNK